ncbi:MAG: redoxin domain-containing protein [Bdellovibrionia bacterium]
MQEPQQEILKPGTRAPEFTLSCTPDQKVSLSELKGSPVVLIFYPADWSPVCSDELAIFGELAPEFKKHGAEVFGISVDGIWCHLAFEKERNIRFTLLSDFEPKGAVAKAYGAYRAKEGVCERALYVIDKEGNIAWSYKSPIGVNPGADGVLNALEKLSADNANSDQAKSEVA